MNHAESDYSLLPRTKSVVPIGTDVMMLDALPCEFRNIELRVLKKPDKGKRDTDSRTSLVPPRKRS